MGSATGGHQILCPGLALFYSFMKSHGIVFRYLIPNLDFHSAAGNSSSYRSQRKWSTSFKISCKQCDIIRYTKSLKITNIGYEVAVFSSVPSSMQPGSFATSALLKWQRTGYLLRSRVCSDTSSLRSKTHISRAMIQRMLSSLQAQKTIMKTLTLLLVIPQSGERMWRTLPSRPPPQSIFLRGFWRLDRGIRKIAIITCSGMALDVRRSSIYVRDIRSLS